MRSVRGWVCKKPEEMVRWVRGGGMAVAFVTSSWYGGHVWVEAVHCSCRWMNNETQKGEQCLGEMEGRVTRWTATHRTAPHTHTHTHTYTLETA